MPFNGAKVFGGCVAVCVATAMLLTPYAGCWPWLSVAIALYPGLYFCNQLEARDRRDARDDRKKAKRKQGW